MTEKRGEDVRQHQGQQREKRGKEKNGSEKSVKVRRKQKDVKTKFFKIN